MVEKKGWEGSNGVIGRGCSGGSGASEVKLRKKRVRKKVQGIQV